VTRNLWELPEITTVAKSDLSDRSHSPPPTLRPLPQDLWRAGEFRHDPQLIKKQSTPRCTNSPAPRDHPQTTYPQHHPQQLWASRFGLQYKTRKNRDLFQWSCSSFDWLLIDQLHGPHGFKGFKGIANTLSTEAPTENVRKSGKVSPVCGKAEHTSIFGRRRTDFVKETSY
jgi:hypothetical protein